MLTLSLVWFQTALLCPDGGAAVQYTGHKFRDPFGEALLVSETAGEARGSVSSFALEGFIWNAKYPEAIINGEIVGVGGKIGPAEILAIEKKGVKIRVRGEEIYLQVTHKVADKAAVQMTDRTASKLPDNAKYKTK